MQVDIDKLLFTGGVLFGSKAFNVSTFGSDTDLAIHRSTFNTLLPNIKEPLKLYEISNYFKVFPRDGGVLVKATTNDNTSNLFNRAENVDLFILNSIRDLNAVRQAVEDIKTYDLTILTHKPSRILVYERALILNGFKHKNWFINLLNKLLPKSIMSILLKDIHEPHTTASK